ncbi:MAG: phosphatidylglycerophosphatase A family protein [Blastocatellia bacterium]
MDHSPIANKRGESFRLNGASDWIAVLLATGSGVGFIPFGPGTFGSMVGLLIVYGLISIFSLDVVLLQNSLMLTSLILAGIGIWASARSERCFDRKDAGQIVIDEVCGQVISFVFIAPYLLRLGPQWRWWMIAGFVLFRLFDIFKPYPINRLQSLEGGLGVMMDDVVAGIYAAVILSLLLFFAV